MSKQKGANFFAKVNADTALQQDFLKAIESKGNESMLMNAAHSAAKEGAAWEGVKKLSDEELALVVGGMDSWLERQ